MGPDLLNSPDKGYTGVEKLVGEIVANTVLHQVLCDVSSV